MPGSRPNRCAVVERGSEAAETKRPAPFRAVASLPRVNPWPARCCRHAGLVDCAPFARRRSAASGWGGAHQPPARASADDRDRPVRGHDQRVRSVAARGGLRRRRRADRGRLGGGTLASAGGHGRSACRSPLAVPCARAAHAAGGRGLALCCRREPAVGVAIPTSRQCEGCRTARVACRECGRAAGAALTGYVHRAASVSHSWRCPSRSSLSSSDAAAAPASSSPPL